MTHQTSLPYSTAADAIMDYTQTPTSSPAAAPTQNTAISHKKTHTPAKDPKVIPRPSNAFILYRNDHQPLLVERHRGQGMSSRDFSKM
ncbi:hypothetical protein HDU98_001465, partial [Podochytrium sp. JEL0797]